MKFFLIFVMALALAGMQPAQAEELPKKETLSTEEWAYQAMLAFAKPEKAPQFPGFEETADETKARYREIAKAIAAATTSAHKSLSIRDQAALLVALGVGESGLSRDTDIGPCYRGDGPNSGWRARCDYGTSGSVWQVHTPIVDTDGEVVRYATTFKDRYRSARIALRLAVGSLGSCKKLEPIDHLSALGGVCRAGFKAAQERYKLWQKVRVWNP